MYWYYSVVYYGVALTPNVVNMLEHRAPNIKGKRLGVPRVDVRAPEAPEQSSRVSPRSSDRRFHTRAELFTIYGLPHPMRELAFINYRAPPRSTPRVLLFQCHNVSWVKNPSKVRGVTSSPFLTYQALGFCSWLWADFIHELR
jgi:hypothetical protein